MPTCRVDPVGPPTNRIKKNTSNSLDLYSGGARFESRWGTGYFQWYFSWVFSVPLVGLATAGVGFPPKARDISLLRSFQTGSGAHPASYPMGTEGFLPGGGGKAAEREADHPPNQLPR
jgi:hypothetical protein